MAFQTTSYMCALSSRERLLLPLVLGLRRWARVRLPQCSSVSVSPSAPSWSDALHVAAASDL